MTAPTCTITARLAWRGDWSPISCGEPATHSNGQEPPFRLVACERHASQFTNPTPIEVDA